VGVEEPFNANISSITKKATTDLDRDAREVTEPIRAVRDDVLEAAGIKLHGCPAKTMRSQARQRPLGGNPCPDTNAAFSMRARRS
jgi:hypothetical protein